MQDLRKEERQAMIYRVVRTVLKQNIPTYGVDDEMVKFSGTRVKRGLYQNKGGNLFNADLIGAGNILRKKFPEIFSKITDFSFLQDIKVIQVFS